MRYGINLLYLIPGVVGGTETYAVSLIRAMTEAAPDNEYVLFLNEEARDLDFGPSASIRRVVLPVRAERRFVRYGWEQFVLPTYLGRMALDVLHSPGYVGPLRAPCPHVLTVPDLNFVALGDAMPRAKRLVLRFMVGASVRGADQILTLSETSRDEIIRYFDLSLDAVTAIHLAPRTGLNKFGSNGIARLRETYSLPEKYCVAFSSLSAHKNISRLIEAFAEIVRDVPQSLVLLGHLPKSLSIVQKIEQAGLRDRVITTGFVPDDDVMPLISGADLFVLPSLYEGFGLPILDAQIQGVAVACSTAGSIPEVAGDGAVFFSPTSVPEIAGAMRSVLLDSKLRLELVERGTRNVARFSWKRTAEQTLAAYGRAIG